jgi:hypothetical protein
MVVLCIETGYITHNVPRCLHNYICILMAFSCPHLCGFHPFYLCLAGHIFSQVTKKTGFPRGGIEYAAVAFAIKYSTSANQPSATVVTVQKIELPLGPLGFVAFVELFEVIFEVSRQFYNRSKVFIYHCDLVVFVLFKLVRNATAISGFFPPIAGHRANSY